MKEAFEKIKEMLEACISESYYRAVCGIYEAGIRNNAYNEALSIVSEVEAKLGKDINVRSNGWIPCSERLPEKSGRVLVSYESINDEIAVSETSYDYKRKTFWISPCVIAWMPLPEPYKPEKGAQDGGDNEGNNKD